MIYRSTLFDKTNGMRAGLMLNVYSVRESTTDLPFRLHYELCTPSVFDTTKLNNKYIHMECIEYHIEDGCYESHERYFRIINDQIHYLTHEETDIICQLINGVTV